MKNFVKRFRVIALVLVIGLSFASCDNGTTTGSSKAKVIEITEIPTEYLSATAFHIFVDRDDGKCLALGIGQLSGSTVTCDLYNVQYTSETSFTQTSNRWTGSGTFDVSMSITIGGDYKYGLTNNISITNAVTTIQASKFTFY